MKNQKKNKNKLLIILIFVIILICIISYFVIKSKGDKNKSNSEQNQNVEDYIQVLEDGTKYNTSIKLKEAKKIENLEISEIQLTYANGQSTVLANVVNTSDKQSSLMKVKITFLDIQGNILTEINDVLIEALNPGASTQLNVGITQDCANAYDFTVTKSEI